MKKNGHKARLLPRYSIISLAAVLSINFLAYFASRLITSGFVHYDFSVAIDEAIPFIPAFSIIYVLAYMQWVIGFILVARENRDLCYKVYSGEIISKLMCLALFMIIPTTMVRPEITSDDFFSAFTNYIYRVDRPDNLFPSIHCLESWLCFRSAVQMKKAGKSYMYFSLIFSLFVFASTVFVKQHVVVDIFAGIAVCEIGQFIAKKANSAVVFERIESHLFKIKNNSETVNEE